MRRSRRPCTSQATWRDARSSQTLDRKHNQQLPRQLPRIQPRLASRSEHTSTCRKVGHRAIPLDPAATAGRSRPSALPLLPFSPSPFAALLRCLGIGRALHSCDGSIAQFGVLRSLQCPRSFRPLPRQLNFTTIASHSQLQSSARASARRVAAAIASSRPWASAPGVTPSSRLRASRVSPRKMRRTTSVLRRHDQRPLSGCAPCVVVASWCRALCPRAPNLCLRKLCSAPEAGK